MGVNSMRSLQHWQALARMTRNELIKDSVIPVKFHSYEYQPD